MAKPPNPPTPATRLLKSKGIAFKETPYDYVEKGGTARASACLDSCSISRHSICVVHSA